MVGIVEHSVERSLWQAYVVLALAFVAAAVSKKSVEDGTNTPGDGGTQEYCWPNVFNASCPENHVILMISAKYGRMRKGKCVTSDGHVGCFADVLNEVDSRCSGRLNCVIEIPDTKLHELQPCPGDMMAYLEAAYQCVKVEPVPKAGCKYNVPLRVHSEEGYISSSALASQQVDTGQCTWVISATDGQRINITLLDFSAPLGRRQDAGVCLVYAIIKEHKGTSEITVCRGTQRLRNVYISEGNTVQVQVYSDPSIAKEGVFLLKYQATGCADPPVPREANYKRTADKVAISCNHSSETWYLYCSGTKWIGPQRNCTASLPRTAKGGEDGGSIFPYSLLTAVIIGIIMGVVIGIALLAVVLMCERRRRRKAREYDQQNSGQDSGEFLNAGDISRICEDQKSQRFSQYGYTHVWELRSLKSLSDETNSVKTLPSSCRSRPEVPLYCEHAYKCREHMYESPSHRAHVIDGTQTVPIGGATIYRDMDLPPGGGGGGIDLETDLPPPGQMMMEVDLVQQSNRTASSPQ